MLLQLHLIVVSMPLGQANGTAVLFLKRAQVLQE